MFKSSSFQVKKKPINKNEEKDCKNQEAFEDKF